MYRSLASFSLRIRSRSIRFTVVAAVCSAVAAASIAMVSAVRDSLDRPARQSEKALSGPFSDINASGMTAIAVGVRGTIALSRDGGASWKQVAVPVSADLTTVRIAKENVVWAIGHDAVVLRSNDGGQTWNRVLDGRSVADLMMRHYRAMASAGSAGAEGLLVEVERALVQSATPGVLPYPFLDIWIGDDGEGFLAGAFGLLLHTVDGGKTWEPWLERAENDRRMHLYVLEQGADGTVYLAGEQGLVRRYDRTQARFVSLDTPYAGTYFGLKAVGTNLVAYGLRGNVFISGDAGKSWRAASLGVTSTVTGVFESQPGRMIFVTQGGHVLESRDGGGTVTSIHAAGREVLGAAMIGAGRLGLATVNGIATVGLSSQ